VKSAKSIAVGPGKWLTLLQAQALPNAPDITTTKRLRDRAIIAVLLGCVPRRSAVAALPDGRCSVGFTPEATVAARPAMRQRVGTVTGRFRVTAPVGRC